MNLHVQRLLTVMDILRQDGASSILDLGCGEGRLLKLLKEEDVFTRIVGIDVSPRAILNACRRLGSLEFLEEKYERLQLFEGSFLCEDSRFQHFDAAVLIEVVEHLNPTDFASFEQIVFGYFRPKTVIVTTPNYEYNVKMNFVKHGGLRHQDHQFEWSRSEFQKWAAHVATTNSYYASVVPVGESDPVVGTPTQMAIFKKK